MLIVKHRKFGLAGLDKVDTANLSANIVSTLQIGCFAGALGAFAIADKWGRRLSLMGMAFVALVGIILQFVSNGHLACMYVGRLVLLIPHNLELLRRTCSDNFDLADSSPVLVWELLPW